MKHPDGTPYWEPTPISENAAAQIHFSRATGEAFTKGGTFIGDYLSLDECALDNEGIVINCIY